MSKRSKSGFTLVELVIVIVVIGILAAIAVPRFADLSEQAKIAATEANRGVIRSAVALEVARRGAAGLTPLLPEDITPNMFADNQIPMNLVNNKNDVYAFSDPEGTWPAMGAVFPGWWYNNLTGGVDYFSDRCNEALISPEDCP